MAVQEMLPIRADQRLQEMRVRYSICTIISRAEEYAEMVDSFKQHGFQEPLCEYLYLDNTQGNVFDSYTGYNLFLTVAQGEYIILCHQDVQLIQDGRAKLDVVLEDMNVRDLNWAVVGNGGARYPGQLVLNISDPHGVNRSTEAFPVRVQSLDENFIIVRRSANLALSHNLEGFHFYGADICIIADILGWNCYVVDFHLRHKSSGLKDESFFAIRKNLIQKYCNAFRPRWIGTTSSTFFIFGISIIQRLLNLGFASKVARYVGRKLYLLH